MALENFNCYDLFSHHIDLTMNFQLEAILLH